MFSKNQRRLHFYKNQVQNKRNLLKLMKIKLFLEIGFVVMMENMFLYLYLIFQIQKLSIIYFHAKKYIKYLYQYIDDKYTEFKEKNKINPHNNEVKEKSENNFNLSIGTLKALELLNKEEHIKFFNINKYDSFSDDIYLVYKIIFQLSENDEIKNAENKKDFFEKMVKYINDNIKENKVGDLFKSMTKNFDFSKDNIFQIKNIIKGNEEKLKLKYFSKICVTTGLIIFLVKDILEYLELNGSNKSNTTLILANLEFIEKTRSKISSYLETLKKYI